MRNLTALIMSFFLLVPVWSASSENKEVSTPIESELECEDDRIGERVEASIGRIFGAFLLASGAIILVSGLAALEEKIVGKRLYFVDKPKGTNIGNQKSAKATWSKQGKKPSWLSSSSSSLKKYPVSNIPMSSIRGTPVRVAKMGRRISYALPFAIGGSLLLDTLWSSAEAEVAEDREDLERKIIEAHKEMEKNLAKEGKKLNVNVAESGEVAVEVVKIED